MVKKVMKRNLIDFNYQNNNTNFLQKGQGILTFYKRAKGSTLCPYFNIMMIKLKSA